MLHALIMSGPVAQLVSQIADRLKAPKGLAGSAIVHVEGQPTSGRSSLLGGLRTQLVNDGFKAILVGPPQRSPDSAICAVAETAVGLHSAGLMNGEFEACFGAKANPSSWDETRIALDRWLKAASGDNVVLLLDEPENWFDVTNTPEGRHFASHARNVATTLLSAPCRKIVTGALSLLPASWHVPLHGTHDHVGWLHSAEWKQLAAPAELIGALDPKALEWCSRLEVRLMVGLAALGDVAAAREWLAQSPASRARKALAKKLLALVQNQQPALASAWRKLALVRRPFADDLLAAVTPGLSSQALAMLRSCLLYPDADGPRWVMHELLRSDATLPDAEQRRAHAELAKHYAGASPADPHGFVLSSLEAFHHATASDDPAIFDGLKPFFVDQLVLRARTLSIRKQFSTAVSLYEQAVQWDPQDDYAHHYLGFNLDVMAADAGRVEKHYRKAIELEPSSPKWHCRLIELYIERARYDEARAAWNNALDALPGTGVSRPIFEELHLWVAQAWLHRNRLEDAEAVLDAVPQALRNHPGFDFLSHQLATMKEVRAVGAFVPPSMAAPGWEKAGPFLVLPSLHGRALARWYAARVEGVADDKIFLSARCIEHGRASTETLDVHRSDYDEWQPDVLFTELKRGMFLEIGEYQGGIFRVRQHRPQKSNLLFMQPTPPYDRYLDSGD